MGKKIVFSGVSFEENALPQEYENIVFHQVFSAKDGTTSASAQSNQSRFHIANVVKIGKTYEIICKESNFFSSQSVTANTLDILTIRGTAGATVNTGEDYITLSGIPKAQGVNYETSFKISNVFTPTQVKSHLYIYIAWDVLRPTKYPNVEVLIREV